MRKQANMFNDSEKYKKIITPIIFLLGLLILWQVSYELELVPRFMFPSPKQVVTALYSERELILFHAKVTLTEAFVGLFWGIILGFIFAFMMDRWDFVFRGFYPIIVLTQTIPTVAIAPLLVLWLGYGMTPKIVLVIMTTFFPITIGIFNGFKAVDRDAIQLMKVMGAKEYQIYWHVKLPAALGSFFSGLKISASYALIGAVVSEWLGGFQGLGVYMTRVRKSMSFDKMLAVIFLISLLSLCLMASVELIQKKSQPWLHRRK